MLRQPWGCVRGHVAGDPFHDTAVDFGFIDIDLVLFVIAELFNIAGLVAIVGSGQRPGVMLRSVPVRVFNEFFAALFYQVQPWDLGNHPVECDQ